MITQNIAAVLSLAVIGWIAGGDIDSGKVMRGLFLLAATAVLCYALLK